MPGQAYEWTCSVCSATWVLSATGTLDSSGDVYADRERVGLEMGYPSCVNETYGCMSAQCLVDLFARYGLLALQAWVTFDQAYAIASHTTGCINPTGQYHYMAMRGVQGGAIWLANSAPGYMGVWDTLDRAQFNALGPVQVIALDNPQP